MGSEWIECTLGDYLTFKNGKSSPEREAAAEKPVYGANGVIGFSDEVNTQSQSLVIGRVGTYCGSVYHTSSDCWVTDNAISCVPKISGESEFWYFKLLALQLNSHRTGSGQPLLNQGILNSIFTGIPKEHSVRYSIGKFLMDFDNKITLNRQINTTLESLAQALFKSWFVDFDPVIDNALAAGNKIPDTLAACAARREALHQQTNKTTGALDAASLDQALPETGLSDQRLPSEILKFFPDRFVLTTELGWVPEEWEVGSVGAAFDVTMGQSPPGDTYNEDGIGMPFFQGRADFGFRYPTNRVYCTSPKRFAKPADTLVSVRAPVGDINMASVDCCIGRGVAAVRHSSGASSYTYYAMLQLREHFKVYEGEGTVFGSINQKDFKALPSLKVPESLLEYFEMYASKLDRKIELSTENINSLVQLRDSLLPKLLSGQITIPDAEEQLAEVL